MKQAVQQGTVSGGNMEELAKHAGEKLLGSPYYKLLCEIAVMCDRIADDENVYMTIGSTRNHSSFMCSIKGSGPDAAAWGGSLLGLA